MRNATRISGKRWVIGGITPKNALCWWLIRGRDMIAFVLKSHCKRMRSEEYETGPTFQRCGSPEHRGPQRLNLGLTTGLGNWLWTGSPVNRLDGEGRNCGASEWVGAEE